MRRTKFHGKKFGISVGARKAKGRELQKWACKKISQLTGYDWGKDCPIESRPMGQSGGDVRMEEKVRRLFPFSVECKRRAKWFVYNWINQAIQNQTPGTDWLVIARADNKKPLVIIDGDKFFELLSQQIYIGRTK
jgi:hypothetical protein